MASCRGLRRRQAGEGPASHATVADHPWSVLRPAPSKVAFTNFVIKRAARVMSDRSMNVLLEP